MYNDTVPNCTLYSNQDIYVCPNDVWNRGIHIIYTHVYYSIQWWDTVKLFGQLPVDKHTDCGLDSLQDTSVRLQDIMSSIHDDPFVLSLLEKRRGQKGFRDLQGESLRNGLDIIFKLLVS